VSGENPSDNVLIDLDGESRGNLLSDPWTAPAGIALLCLDNGFNEFFAGAFWAGPSFAPDEKSSRYFRFFRVWWSFKRVEGFSTVAERIRGRGESGEHTKRQPAALKSGDWVTVAETDSGSGVVA
jgi:hypothetical protein